VLAAERLEDTGIRKVNATVPHDGTTLTKKKEYI
jgi:hypothetical protein